VNNWGKFIGALIGFFIYGAFGAVVGFLVGLLFDKIFLKLQKPHFTKLTEQDLDQVHSEFFSATFSVMGFIATVASQQRGDLSNIATRVMDRIGIPEHRRRVCMDYFEQGQAQDFALYNTVVRFNRLHGDQPQLLEMFVELQLYAAYAKGRLTQEEKDTLLGICYQLDFSHADFDRMENLIKAEFRETGPGKKGLFGWRHHVALSDAYAILNTSPQASDDEVKQAYRRLTSQHHPDKLIAKGMPEDRMRLAEQKTREIRDAYERIKQMRNL
jgi:DnaJ like chaperone protein